MPNETLTSHQEKMFERWSAAWLHSTRDTTRADRRRVEQAIGGLYRAARRLPPVFVWVDSPLAALLARGLLTVAGLEGPLPAPSDGSFNATIPAPQSALFDALRRPSGFMDDLCRQLGGPVRERISRSLVEPLRRQDASEQVWETAYEWLYSSAWRTVWCQLRDGWEGQCRDARVRDVVRDGGLAKMACATVLDAIHAIRELLHMWDEPWSDELWLGRAYLDHQIAQDAFCLCPFRIASSRKCLRQMGLLQVAYSGGWWWPGECVCIVCERPSGFHVDDRGRVHHPSRPAIEFRDGFQVYVWRGAKVPKSWIVAPSSIDPRWAFDVYEHSGEMRRAITEIVGWKRLVELMHPRVIDTDADPAIGELLEVELPPGPLSIGDIELPPPEPRFARFLKVRCGTGREFVLSVPRDLHTAREANAWTYGFSPTEYNLEVRT
jgi:hypothetical protein